MFKNEEGFSLLELVVAVGVAGIIAAVALPTFAGLQDKATTTSATYAASASAAEALANSTMGLTGGASSSAAASSSQAPSMFDGLNSESGAAITNAAAAITFVYDTYVGAGDEGYTTSETWSEATPYIVLWQNKWPSDSITHKYAYTSAEGAARRIQGIFTGGSIYNQSIFGIQTSYVALSPFYATTNTGVWLLPNYGAGSLVALVDGPITDSATRIYEMPASVRN